MEGENIRGSKFPYLICEFKIIEARELRRHKMDVASAIIELISASIVPLRISLALQLAVPARNMSANFRRGKNTNIAVDSATAENVISELIWKMILVEISKRVLTTNKNTHSVRYSLQWTYFNLARLKTT